MAGKENLLAYLVGKDDGPEAERYRQARDSFWSYCRQMNPAFFREDRPHLRELAETLQALEEGTLKAPDGSVCRRLAISEPPRHGKSYTMTLFNQWCFGRNPQDRIINVSYNELLSGRFSKGVRDGIDATKIDPNYTVFSDIFPGVRIKYGDAAAQLWSLEGSYFSFLGAGMGGTITGVGCRKLIIDDPIKNHLEANNDNILAEQWEYYTNTLLSRVEEGGCVVIIMTRWNTRDLVGRVLDAEPGQWYVLNHKACLDESAGTMLCPSLLSFDSWKEKKRLTSPDIFEANYQNMPIDAQGRLYEGFSLYEALPEGPAPVVAYVDTADTGADYLCAVAAGAAGGRGVCGGRGVQRRGHGNHRAGRGEDALRHPGGGVLHRKQQRGPGICPECGAPPVGAIPMAQNHGDLGQSTAEQDGADSHRERIYPASHPHAQGVGYQVAGIL